MKINAALAKMLLQIMNKKCYNLKAKKNTHTYTVEIHSHELQLSLLMMKNDGACGLYCMHKSCKKKSILSTEQVHSHTQTIFFFVHLLSISYFLL